MKRVALFSEYRLPTCSISQKGWWDCQVFCSRFLSKVDQHQSIEISPSSVHLIPDKSVSYVTESAVSGVVAVATVILSGQLESLPKRSKA
jgi:hypothetical protein